MRSTRKARKVVVALPSAGIESVAAIAEGAALGAYRYAGVRGPAKGKDAGDDFREGKVTLPIILAYARANAEGRRFWQDAVLGRRASDADFAEAIARIRATRAADDTLARARHYGQRAIDALGRFESGAAKDAMIEAVEFAVARAY